MKAHYATFFILSCALILSTLGANNATTNVIPMRGLGGPVIDRRQQEGCITIINTQEEASKELLNAAAKRFETEVCVSTKIESGTFDISNPEVKGNVSLFIVSCTNLPMSLVALEDKWACVNVARLICDAKPFFEARVKKEVFRVLSILCGSGGAQFDQCITGCVTSAADLDELYDISMPLEFKARFKKYLPGLGIKPYRVTSYLRACQEGWANSPTNEIQQKVWDRVHAIPKKPLKIQFDPAAQKGKVTK